MHRLKFLSGTTIAVSAVTIGLVVAVGITGLPLLRSGQLPGGAQGASLLHGTGGDGPLPNDSPIHEVDTSQGFGPLAGAGPLQGGGPLSGAGPLQGGAPLFAGTPMGGSGIPGPDGPPPTAVTLASWAPDLPARIDLAPMRWRSGPAATGGDASPDPSPSICVTCFIPPAPPGPTAPANNIVPCSNVTCN